MEFISIDMETFFLLKKKKEEKELCFKYEQKL